LRTKRGLWLAGLLALFVAAAGPRKGYELREVKRRGIDLLFAVDTSRSMLAEDLSPNRLERARLGIHDFVSRLEGDRVGLIPFAGSAYALCPLTSDYEAFRESLDALDTDLIPRQGTNVATAIEEAARLFEEQGNNHRILVLITDGEDLQGDALDMAKEQAKKGMTIYTVGVGSTGGQTIPLRLSNGRMDVVRDANNQPVTTKLDEGTLRQIAEATNGLYVPMGRGAEGLDTIYREKLRLVPKNESEGRMEKVPLERYEWPLAFALICLVMEFLLPDRRRARQAKALPSAARRRAIPGRTAAVGVIVGLLAVFSPDKVQAEATDARVLYNQGTKAYAEGNFSQAADDLRASLNTTDLGLQNRAYYNLGNALYRKGQATLGQQDVEGTMKAWEESIKAYEDASALNPEDGDARYNAALVKRKLDELKKQNPDKDKDKQKKDGEDSKDQKDGEKKDQEKQDGESKDGEKKEGEQKDGKSKDGQQKDGEKKEGQQSGDEEGKEKKEGEGQDGEQKEGKEGQEKGQSGKEDKDGKEKGEKAGKEGEGKDGQKQQGEEKSAVEERRQAQQMQMTEAEAKQLLNMMRNEQRTVIPMERPQQGRFVDPNNTTKGKTW
jgi:Ca-activated chloride channel homolog